jgi:prepilin-type N-terminal cleavage/methylation domain-containing protein
MSTPQQKLNLNPMACKLAESSAERFCQSRKKLNQGFTLIELLVAMAVLLMIAALSSEFIIKGFRSTTFESEQATAIQNARRGMEIMVKEIRGANNSERGDYPLATIESDNLIYYSDINDDGEMEKIRYWADGNFLKKTETAPGAGNNYTGAGATTVMSNYLNNQAEPIFTYYDNNRAETPNINNVRLINIRLKINVTPERAPADYYTETDVHLRNLKDNL